MEISEFSSGQSGADRSERKENSRLESNRVKASGEKRRRAERIEKIITSDPTWRLIGTIGRIGSEI